MKQKFGVLVNSFLVEEWQYLCIKSIIDNGYELPLIIINSNAVEKKVRFKELFFLLFKKVFVRIPLLNNKRDIRTLKSDTYTLRPNTTIKNGEQLFSIADIDLIKTYQLNFLLKFGFDNITGDILNAAKYGVWAFHFGDNRKYIGMSNFFWEIYNREPITCSELYLITQNHNEGLILKKTYLKTLLHSYGKNFNQALALSYYLPTQLASEIENNSCLLSTDEVSFNSIKKNIPSNGEMLFFLIKLLRNKIEYIYKRYFFSDFWHVGYINKPIEEVINSSSPIKDSDINWLKADSRYFFADPFVFEHNNKTLLAVEYLPYKGFKGEIKVFSGDKFQNDETGYAIKENYHLSYPNVIKDKANLYIMPETYQGNNLCLYEKTEIGWTKHIIIENIKCIDPEIIFYNGYYYLFTTIKNNYHDTNLFVYYSKELLNGWKSHLLNPVITDIRRARGAGKIFARDNILYRPGQDYSIHKEGSITICRINELSPTKYSEEVVSSIEPVKDSKYSDKIHTINSYNDITVIDACRIRSFIVRPDVLFEIIKSKLWQK